MTKSKKTTKKPTKASSKAIDNRGKIKSDFPKHSLEEALKVSQAIVETNGGRPLPPADVAIALSISPGSSNLRDILSSSIKYGLTSGSYNGDRISIEDIGRSIVEPTSQESKNQTIAQATITPPTFKSIYEHFRGKKLPDSTFFENTVVREFNIPKEHALKCVNVFLTNVKFAGLQKQANTGVWLSSDLVSIGRNTQEAFTPSTNSEETDAMMAPEKPASIAPPKQEEANDKRAIFIAHGKNDVPLRQLTELLNEYKIPHKIATKEASTGRPISKKVAETMKECGAAILIFTADEEFQDSKGNTVWRPSENIVYELGAASLLYDGRIIIFKEESVDFPANFRDIGYINFAKDNLTAKMPELWRELIAFKLIKISV